MHLAELNVGKFKHPTSDVRMAGFMDNLDRAMTIPSKCHPRTCCGDPWLGLSGVLIARLGRAFATRCFISTQVDKWVPATSAGMTTGFYRGANA